MLNYCCSFILCCGLLNSVKFSLLTILPKHNSFVNFRND